MKSFTGAFVFTCFAVAIAAGQSGRRIETRPVPVATPASLASAPEEVPYSESKPVEKRPIYRPPVRKEKTKETAKSDSADAAGQTPTLAPQDDGEVISVETNLVSVPVSVFDRNGLYIPNLRQTDFKVFDNGEEQAITYFGSSEKPFTVVLLLDTSPSTEYRIEEIQRAAVAFVDQLKPQDKVMVIEFDGNVHVLTEATGDRDAIYKAIKKADFGGGTSLYDAVHFALAKRLKAVEGRKAIVLFTDGVDTTSLKADYDSTLAMAEESESLVFPIYYNTFFDTNRGISTGGGGGLGFPFPNVIRAPAGTTAEEYALGKRYLEDLAAYTGGRIFRPEATPGGLTAAFEGIAEELRRQYVIGYVPDKDGKPGERRRIKVRVERSNLIIRARDSYIFGDKPASATKLTK